MTDLDNLHSDSFIISISQKRQTNATHW